MCTRHTHTHKKNAFKRTDALRMVNVNERKRLMSFFFIYLPFALKLDCSTVGVGGLKWKSRSIKDELPRKCLMNIGSDLILNEYLILEIRFF